MGAGRRHVALVVAATAAVFGVSLANGFVWDDKLIVVGKPVYEGFGLAAMFLRPGNGLEYLPVRDLTYALDHALWGWRPLGFHLTNVLLYVACAAAAWLLASRLERLVGASPGGAQPATVALLSGLLFAVHPLHSEPVSWVIGRNVLLSGLFFFLACWSFAVFLETGSGRRRGWWAGSLVFCLLAFLSKATAIVLPAVLALLVLAHARGRDDPPWRRLWTVAPAFLLAAPFLVLYERVGRSANVISESVLQFGSASVTAKAAVASQVPGFYLGRLLWPARLSAQYDVVFPRSLGAPAVLGGAALLVALVIGAVAAWRQRPRLSFALAFFLVTLLPVSNLLATAPVVADRYAFLPSFGFAWALGGELADMVERRGRWAAVLATTAVVALSVRAFDRNRIWRNDTTLFEATMRDSPGSFISYVNLGYDALGAGDLDRAIALFRGADRIEPGLALEPYGLGNRAFRRGDLRAAVRHLDDAVARRTGFVDALALRGLARERLNDEEGALADYDGALTSPEQDAAGGSRRTAVAGRARLLAAAAPALAGLRAAVAAAPAEVGPRVELGMALDRLGLREEAIAQYQAAERLGLRNWQLFYNLGNAFRLQREPARAAEYYRKCLELQPALGGALRGLGWTTLDLHEFDEAAAAFRAAIAAEPDDGGAVLGLGILYFRAGNREEATRWFRAARDRFPGAGATAESHLRALGVVSP